MLANLCQEYQIDWLLDEIESYLNVARIINLNTQLEYLQLVRKMRFKDNTEIALINKMTAYFPEIRNNPLFALLDRSVKLKITFERFRNLLHQLNKDGTEYVVVKESYFGGCDKKTIRVTGLSSVEKDSLINDKEQGLFYFFKDY